MAGRFLLDPPYISIVGGAQTQYQVIEGHNISLVLTLVLIMRINLGDINFQAKFLAWKSLWATIINVGE